MNLNFNYNNGIKPFQNYEKKTHHNCEPQKSKTSTSEEEDPIANLLTLFDEMEGSASKQKSGKAQGGMQKLMQLLQQLSGGLQSSDKETGDNKVIDQGINKALDSLGLENTGSIQSDLKSITDQYEQNGYKPIFPGKGGGDEVINNLLKSLGLENTGTIQGDLQAITDFYKQNDYKPQASKNIEGDNKVIDQGVNKALDSLNLENTGSIQSDLKSITDTYQQNDYKPIYPGKGGGDEVINNLLRSLGLENTGTIQGDLQAITDFYQQNNYKPQAG